MKCIDRFLLVRALVAAAVTLALASACDGGDQANSAANVASNGRDSTVSVSVGASTFAIPVAYFATPDPAKNGGSPEAVFSTLRIPIDSEPEDGIDIQDSDTFQFTVRPLTQKITEPPLSEESIMAWQQTGDFSDRIVRPDKAARLVRIFDRAEFPRGWHFFENRPTSEAKMEWVAKCFAPEDGNEEQGFINVKCMTEAEFDDMYLEIRFSGTRIGCRDRIVKRALSLASNWRTDKTTQ